ncbi:MAG: hypothetical protein ACP5UZ_08250 [Thermoplasmata archaeon]
MAGKEKSFRHVTSGAYAQKGVVLRTPLTGHLAMNPLGFGSVRIVKGYQEYHNEAKYNNVEAVRERFANAMSGKKGSESLAAKASAACATASPSMKGRCFVGHLSSIGKTMF